jgi:hypothetical protein
MAKNTKSKRLPREKGGTEEKRRPVSRLVELEDHERGIGRGIVYSDDRYPMQPGPDHGPHK